MSKKKETKKALIVTDTQLQVIKDACELYGRIQLGQFKMFSEIVTQTGSNGYWIRVKPERKKDESDKQYIDRCNTLYNRDLVVQESIEGAVEGVYRHAYWWGGRPRTNEADVSLDIWAVLDGRRENDNFHMGSEPNVKVKEVED